MTAQSHPWKLIFTNVMNKTDVESLFQSENHYSEIINHQYEKVSHHCATATHYFELSHYLRY